MVLTDHPLMGFDLYRPVQLHHVYHRLSRRSSRGEVIPMDTAN
ncbi:MAG: hypothetical protein N6V49_01270 [Serratia symbiotica]|nr:hypothetical protein [Serratia symbiotica]